MNMKWIIVFLAFILLFPSVGINFNHNIYSNYNVTTYTTSYNQIVIDKTKNNNDNDFYFYFYTNYDGIEKISPIIEAINGIDVDNNSETGKNGKDIKIALLILPYIQKLDEKWVLAISFALKIIRLGEEIKEGKLIAYFSGLIPYQGKQHNIKLGYCSKEEIPKEIRIVLTVLPYILYEEQPEIYINVEPIFDGDYKNLSIILEYDKGKTLIGYYPACPTIIRFSRSEDKMGLAVERRTYAKQTIKISYEGTIGVNLTLENIPKRIAFTIGYGENYFEYEAEEEFNASLIIEIFGQKGCVKIEYLPRHLIVNFGKEGYIYLYIDEKKTKFLVCDDLVSPSISLSIYNLSGEAELQWVAGREGYISIKGFKGMETEFFANKENIYFRMFSQLKAENFVMGWNISSMGYISFDTNWEWLCFYSLNLTIDKVFGVLVEANMLRAEDFKVSWNAIPPSFQKTGKIEFIGDFIFSIMLNGKWYDVF